ncbi:MAG: PAS domain S-box protein [Methanoregulaceae archaeon]|nr:PAS domain S-box protein [Methanoregulaceae archaeon]
MAPARKRDKKEERAAVDNGPMKETARREPADRKGIHPCPGEKTPDEIIQELQVQQIELEMQADKLRRTQRTLEEARDRYLELYDFAPVGYLTLTDAALVHETNLTGAKLLGMTRSALIDTLFRKFINPGDCDRWDRYFTTLRMQDTSRATTLLLKRADGSIFPARLEGIRLSGGDGMPLVRIAFSDVTDTRQVEEELHQRLQMEELVATIAHRFISTAAGEIAGELRHALGKIGECTGADRCIITLLSRDGRIIEETYEWCPDRTDPIEYYLTGMSVAGFPWLLSMMAGGEQVIVSRPEVLPSVADAEKKFLKNIGAKGVVITPLALSGHLIGMFFILYRRGRKWTKTDRSFLETAGDLFVNVIARKRNVDALMESEQKYRTLFDNYLNPIIIAGDDGRLTDANTAAMDLMERGVNDLRERPVRELMPGFDMVLRQTPQSSPPRTIETEYTIHGTTKNLLVQVVPLTIGNRTILYGIGQDITARKRAEQEIREQKTFLETILREAADGIVVCDARGSYLYLNDAARRIGGIAMDADISAITPSSWGKACLDGRPIRREDWTLEKALRGVSSIGVEVHLSKADGSAYDLLISAAPVRSPAQNILGAVATFRDITDRKRAEQEIREQKIFLEAILAEAADPIVVCDHQGKYLFINQAGLRMAGIEPGSSLSRISPGSWGRAYDTNGRPIRREQMALERALRGESVIGLESRIVRPDGSEYHILISAAPVRSAAHHIIGAVATFRDITDRKRAEEQLRETTEYLDNLLTYANAPIVVWDPDLRITRFNRAFERITGRTEGEMRGRPVNSLFPPGFMEQSLTLVRRAAAGDRWESVEIPIIHEDGTVRTILWNSANILSRDDRLIATIAQGLDITDRKEAELRVAESEAKLRALIEALPIGISLIDEHRNVIGSNPALNKILDYSEDELARKEFIRRVYIRPDGTEIRQDEFPSICALEENRTVRDVEIGIVKEDGTIIWTNVSAQPLPFPDWRVVLATADITGKKQAEQALQESEERFRQIASFTQENPAPILEVHDDGSVSFANIATGLALRRHGLQEDPKIFFPPDMEMILAELRKGIDAFYYREVPIGDAIYGESIYLSPIHNAIRIYAQDVTAYRRSRQEGPE